MEMTIGLNEEPTRPDNIDSYSSASRNVDPVISLLAMLQVFTGLLFLPYIQSIFSLTIYPGPIFFTFFAYFVGGLLLMTLPVFFILGLAIWGRRLWARKISVIANAICLILTLFGQIIFPAMLNIVSLLMLNSTDVRAALEN
jgi:hypothetical protein